MGVVEGQVDLEAGSAGRIWDWYRKCVEGILQGRKGHINIGQKYLKVPIGKYG